MKFYLPASKSLIFVIFSILFLLLSFNSNSIEILLTDGTQLEGDIISQNDEEITLKTDIITVTIPRIRIKNEIQSSLKTSAQEDSKLSEAEELFKTGRFKEASLLYQEILKDNPLNEIADRKLRMISEFIKTKNNVKTDESDETTSETAAKKVNNDLNINDENVFSPAPSTITSSTNNTQYASANNVPKEQFKQNDDNKLSEGNNNNAKPPLIGFSNEKTSEKQQNLTYNRTQSNQIQKTPANPLEFSSSNISDTSYVNNASSKTFNNPPIQTGTEIQTTAKPPMTSEPVSQSFQQNSNPLIANKTNSIPPMQSVSEIPVQPQTNTQTNFAQQPMQQQNVQLPTTSQNDVSIKVNNNISRDNSNYLKIPENYNINSPEFRSVWITRFEWPDKNPETAKQNIVRIMKTLSENNYNAAIFQIRGQGDVLYKSPKEPWSSLLGSDPGFDPLEFAINEAHKNNIEFHAYINLMPIWQGEALPPHTNPEHPYWLYCSPESKEKWICIDKNGNPMQPLSEYDKYIYLSAGIPAVHDYLRDVVTDVVKRYNVDGIHFDRIRYPGTAFSHDTVSEQRFNGDGNPDKLSWDNWQRDQIIRMLNNIYGACYAIKPKVKISSAPWGIYDKTRLQNYSNFSSGYHDYYQDSHGWIKAGVMDALIPMIYWDSYPVMQKLDGKKAPCYFDLVSDFQNSLPNRHIYPGQPVYKKGAAFENDEFVKEINYSRAAGCKGNVGYSYGSSEQKFLFQHLAKTVYTSKVPTPDMPWKSNPQTGIIIGYVKDSSGNPVMDAKLNLSGKSYNWLSSADGFFAMLDINPSNNNNITATKNGVGNAEIGNISVVAGKATSVEIILK